MAQLVAVYLTLNYFTDHDRTNLGKANTLMVKNKAPYGLHCLSKLLKPLMKALKTEERDCYNLINLPNGATGLYGAIKNMCCPACWKSLPEK